MTKPIVKARRHRRPTWKRCVMFVFVFVVYPFVLASTLTCRYCDFLWRGTE